MNTAGEPDDTINCRAGYSSSVTKTRGITVIALMPQRSASTPPIKAKVVPDTPTQRLAVIAARWPYPSVVSA